jgi:hypothetical protein
VVGRAPSSPPDRYKQEATVGTSHAALAHPELIWIDRITTSYRRTVEGFFDTGDLLFEAKKALSHGKFEKMCRFNLPFGERMAQYYMAISRDQRLRKAQYIALLPAHVVTLYALTKLTDAEFDAAIEKRKLNPDMEKSDAAALAVAYNEAHAPPPIAVHVKVIPQPPAELIRVEPRLVGEENVIALPLPQKDRPPVITKEEDEESHQESLFEEACQLLESMADQTRQKFFAYLRKKYRQLN